MEDKDIVEQADKVMKKLLRPELKNGVPVFWRGGQNAVTTSQIRKFLTAVNTVTNKINIYNIKGDKKELSDDLAAEVKYLKVKVIYQAGKEKGNQHLIARFIEEADLINQIDNIGKDIAQYEKFAKYIEALVAYHKFYGGKD